MALTEIFHDGFERLSELVIDERRRTGVEAVEVAIASLRPGNYSEGATSPAIPMFERRPLSDFGHTATSATEGDLDLFDQRPSDEPGYIVSLSSATPRQLPGVEASSEFAQAESEMADDVASLSERASLAAVPARSVRIDETGAYSTELPHLVTGAGKSAEPEQTEVNSPVAQIASIDHEGGLTYEVMKRAA